jgi:TRAP-type mannitol/chloroaromatic compound transport system permease small subunit
MGCNEQVGHTIYWLILVAVIVSAGNSTVRYVLDTSSNAWLELQSYLFSAVFLLGAEYPLLLRQGFTPNLSRSPGAPLSQAW